MERPDIAREYHAATDRIIAGGFRHPERLLDFQHDPDNAALEFKEYDGRPRLDIVPGSLVASANRAVDVLSGIVPPPQPLDARLLARLLAFSGGITRMIDRPGRPRRYCRATSSAHTYPDLYVVCGDLPGLTAGVYYFHSLTLQLISLREGDYRASLAGAAAEGLIAAYPVSIVITGIPWRAAWRYCERALRHVYWDTGGLIANLVTIADASGVESRVRLGFVDSEVAALVGVDQVHQFPVAVLTFGPGGSPALTSPPVDPLEGDDPPIAVRAPVLFPLMLETHRAGDLGDSDAVAGWRARRSQAAAATWAYQVRAPDRGSAPIEEVILSRGSTRVMSGDSVPADALDWAMSVSCRSMPGDWAPDGAGLLDHFVAVFAVAGVPAGLYRKFPSGRELIRAGDFRQESRMASMRQGQGGDGAYASYHCADLERVVGALGPRGYRAAQIEGGWVLERLHLAAFALGIGATGLTFFDLEVSRLFDTDAAVMTEVAVGMPAYRARKGVLGPGATRIKGCAIDMLEERIRQLQEDQAQSG